MLQAKLQKDLQAQPQHIKSILSPLINLPLNVLQELFTQVLPNTVLGHDGRERLINLGLVCKRWRNATLQTRRLWSGVVLSPGSYLEETSYKKVKAWLERSGGRPKTLKLDPFESDYGIEPCDCYKGAMCNYAEPTLIRLLTEGPKIDHFELFCPTPDCVGSIIERMKRSAGQPLERPWDTLRSFSLAFPDEEEWDLSEDPVSYLFQNLPPNLTSLHIHLPPGDPENPPPSNMRKDFIKIPQPVLSRLTAFTIKCQWEGMHVPKVLKHCVNVETLIVDFDFSEPLSADWCSAALARLAKSRIVLRNVKTLRLKNCHSLDLLRYIKTPSLRVLDLGMSGGHDVDTDFKDVLFTFLKASGLFKDNRTLSSLRVYAHTIAITDVRDIVAAAISGKELKVERLVLERLHFGSFSDAGVDLWTAIGHKTETLQIASARRKQAPRVLKHVELVSLQDNYPLESAVRVLADMTIPLTASYNPHQTSKSQNSKCDKVTEEMMESRGLSKKPGFAFRIVPGINYYSAEQSA